MVRYTSLPDNKDLPFGAAHSIHDSELCAYRDLFINNFTLDNNNTFLLSTYKTEIDTSTNTILQLGYSYSDNEDDAKIISARKVILFKPSKELKKKINNYE